MLLKAHFRNLQGTRNDSYLVITTSWWSSLKARVPIKLWPPSGARSPGRGPRSGTRPWCGWCGGGPALRDTPPLLGTGNGWEEGFLLPSLIPETDPDPGSRPRCHPAQSAGCGLTVLVAGAGEVGCTGEPGAWVCTEGAAAAVGVCTAGSCPGGAAVRRRVLDRKGAHPGGFSEGPEHQGRLASPRTVSSSSGVSFTPGSRQQTQIFHGCFFLRSIISHMHSLTCSTPLFKLLLMYPFYSMHTPKISLKL